MEVRSLNCLQCGADFEFTPAEQTAYAARGFAEPKRCPRCRTANRRRKQAQQARPQRPAQRSAGADPPPRPPKSTVAFDAVCSVCGTHTTVPFQPDGVRPVYCMPCLKQRTR